MNNGNRIVVCEACGYTIVDNPAKHRYRDKYCPECRAIYKKAGFAWKLNLPFTRFKKWLVTLKQKHYESNLKGRALHQLRLELEREPTVWEVGNRLNILRMQDEEAKVMRKLREK